jgi:hypothetical protein
MPVIESVQIPKKLSTIESAVVVVDGDEHEIAKLVVLPGSRISREWEEIVKQYLIEARI